MSAYGVWDDGYRAGYAQAMRDAAAWVAAAPLTIGSCRGDGPGARAYASGMRDAAEHLRELIADELDARSRVEAKP